MTSGPSNVSGAEGKPAVTVPAHHETPRPPGSLQEAGTGRAVSRVLFPGVSREMVICLGWPSSATSSSLPAAVPLPLRARDRCGHTSPLIWPCSDWGLPCHRCCQRRGGLLPHRFTLTQRLPAGRSVLCCPVRRLAAPRRYLAVCPVELGLSSSRPRDRPATIALDQQRQSNSLRASGLSLAQAGQPTLRLRDERL